MKSRRHCATLGKQTAFCTLTFNSLKPVTNEKAENNTSMFAGSRKKQATCGGEHLSTTPQPYRTMTNTHGDNTPTTQHPRGVHVSDSSQDAFLERHHIKQH